jgi:hypothetical protein
MVLKIGIIDQKSELGLIPIKKACDFTLANPSHYYLSADIICNIYNISDQTFFDSENEIGEKLPSGAKCVLTVCGIPSSGP